MQNTGTIRGRAPGHREAWPGRAGSVAPETRLSSLATKEKSQAPQVGSEGIVELSESRRACGALPPSNSESLPSFLDALLERLGRATILDLNMPAHSGPQAAALPSTTGPTP